MDNNIWYHTLFRVKLHEAAKEQFQRLFSDVMHAHYGQHFRAVSPWGRAGDGGNDGFLPEDQHYYQVYGPMARSPINAVRASEKAKEDFELLLGNYPNLRQYSFVINDRFEGVPAPIFHQMDEISSGHGIAAGVLDSRDLMHLFDELDEPSKQAILSSVPVPPPTGVDAHIISQLLSHLIHEDGMASMTFLGKELAPDFVRKIEFNQLSQSFAALLTFGSYYIAGVDRFFHDHPGSLQVAAKHMRELYSTSVEMFADDAQAPNLRFIYILDHVARNNDGAWRQQAAIIMAKFFEVCDIYEQPPV